MTEPAVAPTDDRQQRLRERIDAVQEQLTKTRAAVNAATTTSTSTADKLEKQRKALSTAEQEHSRAVSHLSAVQSELQQYQGELTTLTRRLEMASIVRKARA